MKNVAQLLNLDPVKGLFGIELEIEGENLPDVLPDGWRMTDDGSLRGEFPRSRAEYVFNRPLTLIGSTTKFKKLIEHLAERNAKANFSYRTSMHVHMNVGDLSQDQYLSLIYTYYLLETALVRYCGEERVGNRFCLRLQDADNNLFSLTELFKNGVKHVKHFRNNNAKYAALNLASTSTYGSLEFRSMPGNLNLIYVSNWLKALNNLREYACQMDNPRLIHNSFIELGPSQFMKTVLKDVYQEFAYDEQDADMQMMFSITIELPLNYESLEKRMLRIAEDIERKRIYRINQIEIEAKVLRQENEIPANFVLPENLLRKIQQDFINAGEYIPEIPQQGF